MENQKLKAVWK